MAIPTTREGLKQYCLRDLGAPVLEINVDDDQLEDRIDESLDYWRQYHYDGIEEIYLYIFAHTHKNSKTQEMISCDLFNILEKSRTLSRTPLKTFFP